jgi:hypothetical protein
MIGVMSDSHDNIIKIKKAVEIFNEKKCDLVIHAGDFIAPFSVRELEKLNCPIKAVYGNCDGEKLGLKKVFSSVGEIQESPLIFEYNNLKIFVCHVPNNLDNLAHSGKFNIIIYGHTHEPKAERKNNTLILNPGETCGWLSGKGTIALIDPVKISWNFIEL